LAKCDDATRFLAASLAAALRSSLLEEPQKEPPMRLMAVSLAFLAVFSVLIPALASADVVGGCNYTLKNYSDRGSIILFNRSGGLTMQMVLDDDVSVFQKLKTSSATGDQVRQLAKSNADFAKDMADSHIFPSDVRSLNIYLADPAAGATQPAASYYGFFGDQNVFLGGFGTVGGEWFVCNWQ